MHILLTPDERIAANTPYYDRHFLASPADRPATVSWLLAGSAMLILLLGSCKARCSDLPPFEETAATLAACLAEEASAAEVEAILRGWERVDSEWGGVSQADIAPGGEEEFILRYHADLEQVSWSPQGKLVILGRNGRKWRVIYDASSIEIRTLDGRSWDNWSYRVVALEDATGDGFADPLVELLCSNGLRTVISYLTLISAHPGDDSSTLQVAFLEETTFTRPSFALVPAGEGRALQMEIPIQGTGAITRTYTFDGATFLLDHEAINPAASYASLLAPDGTGWYAFDQFDGMGGSIPTSPQLGVYRLKEGELSHWDIAGAIRVLRAAPDGTLYAGTGCGLMRFRDERWETLLEPHCGGSPVGGPIIPFDLEIAENGDLWLAGIFALLRYDGHDWTRFPISARRILLAPDGTLWADGWDGRANSGCCYTHLTGESWVT